MTTSLPPGPPLPVWVQTLAFFTRPLGFLDACHRRYGDRFTVCIAGFGTAVYLADPTDVRTVFRGDPDTFRAGEANAMLATVLGPRSVLVTDGPAHTRARRRMTPAFHGDAVARQGATMAEVARDEAATWTPGTEIALMTRMQAVTLEIILRTVIGTRDPARLSELRRVLPPMVDLDGLATMAMLRPGLRRLWPWRRRLAVLRDADRVLLAEITATRGDPGLAERDDVLAVLVRGAADGGVEEDDAELRDQLATLLLAGHETTATGLCWTLEQLVRHPDVLARAVAAADDGGVEGDRFLDAVVAESLRVRPVVSDVARRLARPVEVGDRTLPAGVLVSPAIALIQRDDRHHSAAAEFRPDRHLGVRPDPSTWFPFGGGVRRCVGAAFALTEMRIVLREILRGVELAPTDAPPEQPRARHVTLVPHRGARVTIRSRRTPVAADVQSTTTR